MTKEHIECLSCKYKNWDCKNCFIDREDGDNINVTFFLIMTRQCNLRCNYCAINFSDELLSYECIDRFISFLKKSRSGINELRLEFFGGEPLLEFEKIKYIVDALQGFSINAYSIVTNGLFLNQEHIDFFSKNKFQVIFSVAFHTKKLLQEKKILLQNNHLSNFLINFIIEPGKEMDMYDVFKELLRTGFKKFSLIPIRYTKKRGASHLEDLESLLFKIRQINNGLMKKNINLGLFTGKNDDDFDTGIGKNDFEIVLNVDGKLYADYEVELYILRDFVPKEIFNVEDTCIGNILDDVINIDTLLVERNKIKPHFFINNISDYLQMDESDTALGKVMSKYNVNVL